jgi:hypothetical protein
VTGYWAYSSHDIAEAPFGAFTHSLAHRGPDGSGIEHFPEVRLWFGHRRLAIVDLSERARQPMSYAEGRYWPTYNGEVYNYLESRKELRGLGHRFVSDSDDESSSAPMPNGGRIANFASMASGLSPSWMPASIGCSCRVTASASSHCITAITPVPSSCVRVGILGGTAVSCYA